ncbi:PLP-dependent aspartate aminotransferase family protein [Frigidibacter sp.]|uniref:trans-sulfuration enzyme family protein n=1 Tax=Frigidibacter sp. TaxID=2586418 RepID=UPI0027342B53|nr:PLP-dependent transferase [Frigidibacter sp.]MDP3339350.1 PLP-dependent transferase [Frigidibacter sp.]
MKIDTLLAGLDGVTDGAGGLVPPLRLSVTHAAQPGGPSRGYARSGPDGETLLETILARLDEAASALAFASGASAAQAALALVPPGREVLLEAEGYYEFRGIVQRATAARGLSLRLVEMTDLAAVAAQLSSGRVGMVWAEFPGNPLWQVPDLRRLSALSHGAGALLLVDATAATPHHIRPLTLGADVVLHSATKFLNGHGDLMAGALALADPDARAALVQHRTDTGTILAPFSEWLLLRGLRTFVLRMERASATAARLAVWLADQGLTVHYPGLPDHPQHAIACAQYTNGFGPMLSFRMGTAARADAVVAAVRIFRRATSLGSTESLIERRAATEGPGTRCPADLIRLSIGLEAAEDLIGDLQHALDTINRTKDNPT